MSLEISASGPLVDRAIDRAVDNGTLTALLELLAALPEHAGAARDAMLARLTSVRTITKLVAREPIDFDSLDRLLPQLPVEAFNPLLDTLATSENRTVRRKLLDRLSVIEVDISSLITSRLYDDRWFVQRNMLVLLERSGQAPPGFSAATWAEHLDPRVRHQAIRFQLTLPHERTYACGPRSRTRIRVSCAWRSSPSSSRARPSCPDSWSGSPTIPRPTRNAVCWPCTRSADAGLAIRSRRC